MLLLTFKHHAPVRKIKNRKPSSVDEQRESTIIVSLYVSGLVHIFKDKIPDFFQTFLKPQKPNSTQHNVSHVTQRDFV